MQLDKKMEIGTVRFTLPAEPFFHLHKSRKIFDENARHVAKM